MGISYTILLLLGVLSLRGGIVCRRINRLLDSTEGIEHLAISCRKHSASLLDYGGVGDGKTLNTKAFKEAIDDLSKYASDGGAQLIVPSGKWLTGAFNLTSSFTLYLEKDATILASEEEDDFPLVTVLPSYGRGRDAAGDGFRYQSLIFGSNLTDVVITGANGTIDGQGDIWWKKFKKDELKYTRPYLIEILFSENIQISNLTLLNSPSWHVHPVYSNNIVIQGLSIFAPYDPVSPNTDGINPDSCSNVRIEDCYIVSGDDCVAIKSGWDQYGIQVGIPTKHVIIKRLTCISPDSAVIALGSEMSGGIEDVRAEDILAINSQSGVRIKSAPGRGGYVKDIFIKGMTMKTMKYVFWMAGTYGQHADDDWDPKALPIVRNINFDNVTAENVTMSANLAGIKDDPFTEICFSNVNIEQSVKPKKVQWNCTDIEGTSSNVSPKPCSLLPEESTTTCAYPTDTLPIEDVEMKMCSYLSISANQLYYYDRFLGYTTMSFLLIQLLM